MASRPVRLHVRAINEKHLIHLYRMEAVELESEPDECT